MFDPDIPEIWLNYSDRSYVATRLLGHTNFLLDTPVHVHRTLELFLKTYIVSTGEKIRKGERSWGHNLESLRKVCESHNSGFSEGEFIRRLVHFQKYFDIIRDPSAIGDLNNRDEGSIFKIPFSFDSSIEPMDELVAFIRPRINVEKEVWRSSIIYGLVHEQREWFETQANALKHENNHLDNINCSDTNNSDVEFNPDFDFDLPGC